MSKKPIQTEKAAGGTPGLVPTVEDEAESRLTVRRAIEETRREYRTSSRWWASGALREASCPAMKKAGAHDKQEAPET